MKTICLALAALSLSTAALADFVPGRERPIMRASDMEVTSVRFGFQGVQRVDVSLNKADGIVKPTSLDLAITAKDEQTGELTQTTRHVVVTDVRSDGCGSVQYTASLKSESNAPMGARFSVSLVDHSHRICEDYKPFLWEVSVREGFGWCGTGDSTMTLQGNPEHLAITM